MKRGIKQVHKLYEEIRYVVGHVKPSNEELSDFFCESFLNNNKQHFYLESFPITTQQNKPMVMTSELKKIIQHGKINKEIF